MFTDRQQPATLISIGAEVDSHLIPDICGQGDHDVYLRIRSSCGRGRGERDGEDNEISGDHFRKKLAFVPPREGCLGEPECRVRGPSQTLPRGCKGKVAFYLQSSLRWEVTNPLTKP